MFRVHGKTLLMLGAVLLSATLRASAVDIYDGVRAPRGLYFLSYSTLYVADDLTGDDGHSTISDFGYLGMHETLRLSWYSPNYVLTTLVPFGYVESDYLDDDDAGLGDVLVAAGGFLPIKSIDCLGFLAAKIPTGEFDADKSVNIGSGQWDFYPSMYLHKAKNGYTFDGVAKYFFRQENDDNHYEPGDELLLEAQASKQIGKVKVGPGVKWLKGEDQERDGDTVPDSAKQVVALGGEAWFKLGGWSCTLNYMADVYTENTTRGHLFRLKFVKKL